ncbi:DAGKc domain-containing protein [Mycena chlorophos]|uniref:DAGKc domain-containing protein n=1 Tax=Mycena chlorophos TaxID=658473 RepID=A0A8H6WSG7_MYCCL|nr:DAGKc domain-containing protein [Mycena chlorophos]
MEARRAESDHWHLFLAFTPMSIRVRGPNGKLSSLSYQNDSLQITNGSTTTVPLRQVLGAKRASRSFELSYLRRSKTMGLETLTGILPDEVTDDVADAWIETLLQMAYEGMGVSRQRRLKVVINPHGGTKKAVGIFKKSVEPIFLAAECTLDVVHTTRPGHAYDIGKDLSLTDYDAIAILSGDGLVHEILNGLAHNLHPIKALATPLAPIPTGTGNGLSLNILGFDDGFDVGVAALNAVKGLPMKVDLCSVTQNGKRTISFMSQAMGLMADLDIGTEHLRWMGEARFSYGFLRGCGLFVSLQALGSNADPPVIKMKPSPLRILIKEYESDKEKMFEALQQRKKNPPAATKPAEADLESTQLPTLKYALDDEEGWTVVQEPLLYLFAGKGPYVGRHVYLSTQSLLSTLFRDYMSFPVSLPDDGLLDIVLQTTNVSRVELLRNQSAAPKGLVYWHPSVRYVKAHAYRVKPLASKGALAVDGEIFPFEEFQVEAHSKLGCFLSPFGYYAAPFERHTY